MTSEVIEDLAAQGVTRLAAAPPAGSLDEQREQISAFADRFSLR